jgi:ketosteroid isomerase-like protein
MWRDINESLTGFRIEPLRVEAHGDRFVVDVRAEGVGAGSGADVNESWVQVWTVRGGKIARVEAFPTREEAIEAATSA